MSKSLKKTADLAPVFYWDTSALLSLVFEENDSLRVQKFVREESALPGYTSFFTSIEMESALFRRIQEGSLNDEISVVREGYRKLNTLISYLWADESLLLQAKRCTFEYGLRPGDALQLATALEIASEIQPLVLVTLDSKLKKCAVAAGLTIFQGNV